MKQKTYIKESIITAMCIALCVVLPMAFHLIPNVGSLLSPMHIPVLLCGLICGGPFGFFCGLAGPFLSSILTQMPPMAYLPGMLVELSVYGLVAGLMRKIVHTKKLYVDLYICLITSMIAGRIAAGIANALIFQLGEYSIAIWMSSYFITAWPGIVAHLVFIPTIVFALEKANLIPTRHS